MSVSRNGMLFPILSALWNVAFVTTDTLLCHGFSTALPLDSLVPQELTAEAVFTDIPLAALATAVGYLIPFGPLERVGAIATTLTHISRDSTMLSTVKPTDSLQQNRTAEDIFTGIECQ